MHDAVESAVDGTSIAEPDKFSWTLGSILLAICLLALVAVALNWPDSLAPSAIGATARRLAAALVRPDTRTTSLDPVDRYEAERNSMDHSQQEYGVPGVPLREKAPAATDTRPDIATLPAVPVIEVDPIAVTPPINVPDAKIIKPKEQARARTQRRVARGVQRIPPTKPARNCFAFNSERYCE